jgi:hypothetical protein
MSNARCLTEGVDVPAVDVVAFLAPRKSKVDIVQAAGRAMRKPDDKDVGYVKETGYILLPLFLETQKNESLEEAVRRTDYEQAWDVLQAMQEQDEVLADIIREMREERGRLGGFDDSRLRERVEVLGPELSLDVLRSAVSTAIVDRLGVTWDERYGELESYKQRFGNCNVPKVWEENQQLSNWVGIQRLSAAEGKLSPLRRARLDDLGFVWNTLKYAWDTMFIELTRYRDRFGDCNVTRNWEENPELATWVHHQRRFKSAGKHCRQRAKRVSTNSVLFGIRRIRLGRRCWPS